MQTQLQPNISQTNLQNKELEQQLNQLKSSKPYDDVQQNTKYQQMLAERPQNVQQQQNTLSHKQQQSNKKLPSKKQLPQKQKVNNTGSKTSMNFNVPKRKKTNVNMNNSPKSSQNWRLKNNNSINSIQQSNINNGQYNTLTVLNLLYQVICKMRQRGDDMTLECLLNEEKLIYIAIEMMEKKAISLERVNEIFSLNKEIISFIQKINKEEDQNIDMKIFSKAVDLLMRPQINKYLQNDLKTLGKIKILTFNNLACIYQKKKKYGIALRSVSFALQIEQSLLKQQSNQQKYDIIPTYLNKAAILSQMKKHQNAIQQIMKSQKFIQKIQKQVIKQITEAEQSKNEELKKRLEQKRYYGLYMKMIINYNMGAEKQHMRMKEQACEYYKQGRQLAILINNQYMIKKFEIILQKLMQTKRMK